MPAMGKRRFRRFAVNVSCFVKPSRVPKASTERVIPAQTRNISRGGLSIVANGDWEVGTDIECVILLPIFPLPHKPVRILCRGKIVRVVPKEEGGMEIGATIGHISYLNAPGKPGQSPEL